MAFLRKPRPGGGSAREPTSSSTPDSTPSSINRSSHVLMTFGADPGSSKFTPSTLILRRQHDGEPRWSSEALWRPSTDQSLSICPHRLVLLPSPAVTRSSTWVDTAVDRSSAVRSSAQLITAIGLVEYYQLASEGPSTACEYREKVKKKK